MAGPDVLGVPLIRARHPSGYRALRLLIAGFLAPVVLLLEVAASGRYLPSFDQFLSTNLRMLEHLGPQLLVLALVLALGLGALGARRTGAVLAVLAVLGGAAILRDYRAVRTPPATTSDLRLLWFNVLHENATPPDRIAAAIRGSGADVVLLAEALPMREARIGLADLYPYQLGCADADRCGLILLSRFPFSRERLRDFPTGPERFLRVVLEVPGHGDVALAGVHETKPWYLGLTGGEAEIGKWALRPGKATPMVVAGDFNAAPWSLRMRSLVREQSLRFAERPVPTWPASAGRFGVPIDHVLVRRGATILGLAPWGADLGSNHRGLIAELDLP